MWCVKILFIRLLTVQLYAFFVDVESYVVGYKGIRDVKIDEHLVSYVWYVEIILSHIFDIP